MRMCRAEEDAKDVLQETLLAAARTLPDFRGASSVSTWLYTIARSFCIKQRRRSKFAPEAVESLDAGAPRPLTQYYGDVSAGIQREYSPPRSVDADTTPKKTTTLLQDVLKGDALL